MKEERDLNEFIRAQVSAIAGPEKRSTSGKRVTREQRSYHRLLYPQIRFLWEVLNDKEKEWVTTTSEEKRIDVDETRDSPTYTDFFVKEVLGLAKKDLESGNEILKSRIMALISKQKTSLFAYNPTTGKRLVFDRFLGIQEDQNVYLMTDETNTKWVVKWESSNTGNVDPEMMMYAKLRNMGAQVPNTLEGYQVLDFGILVIEFLQPLDVTDRADNVGVQLLLQLKYIHTFACYFDLKTDNIRKRSSIPPLYFIIDMNLSTEMRQDGTFKRKHWTPFYASQTFPPSPAYYQRSSYVNDFIELKYVLNQMIAKQSYAAKAGIYRPGSSDLRKQQLGLREGDFLADPDSMIENDISNTARGWRAIRNLLEYCVDTYCLVNITSIIENLEHGFPPANIHELLSEQLKQDPGLKRLYKETNKNIGFVCKTCSSINTAYRCGGCYYDTTFLCSGACAQHHKCN